MFIYNRRDNLVMCVDVVSVYTRMWTSASLALSCRKTFFGNFFSEIVLIIRFSCG